MKAFDLWHITKDDHEPNPLRQNPTVAQIKQHSEDVAKILKAFSTINSFVSNSIFMRIMAYSTKKEALEKFQE